MSICVFLFIYTLQLSVIVGTFSTVTVAVFKLDKLHDFKVRIIATIGAILTI